MPRFDEQPVEKITKRANIGNAKVFISLILLKVSINRAIVHIHSYLCCVNWKERIGRWYLSRTIAESRVPKGCNLRNAQSVGLLYLERDHQFYHTIKDLAKHLKFELGVKSVSMLSFVNEDAKNTPGWLVKKLGSGFFCKSDLNWYGKPINEVQQFIESDFDILIDLELEPVLALKYILKSSNAKMKVGPEQIEFPSDYDINIGVAPILKSIDDDVEKNDDMSIWQEQTERTFQFITEANIQ